MGRTLEGRLPTIRKYEAVAISHGYELSRRRPAEGWRASWERAAPELMDPEVRLQVSRELFERHDVIRGLLERY